MHKEFEEMSAKHADRMALNGGGATNSGERHEGHNPSHATEFKDVELICPDVNTPRWDQSSYEQRGHGSGTVKDWVQGGQAALE